MPELAVLQSNLTATYDVLGIGNAIVDIVTHTDDETIQALGLEKNAMTLIDEERSEALYRQMRETREVSGGSCANTVAAVAAMGGRASFIGKVRNDPIGRAFAEDIKNAGVDFKTALSEEGPLTARCMIFVTPDAKRTMQTYLGACVELSPADVDATLVQSSAVTYLEGYLWDKDDAKAACLKAIKLAHDAGRQVALTLSDGFCVDRWRDEFQDLVSNHIDIVFANEVELLSLYSSDDFGQALGKIRDAVNIAAVTRSEHGSIVCNGSATHEIPADLRGTLVDTTGAGDLYAAGFLRALTAGLDLECAGRLGSAAAGQIITHYGARAEQPLAPLFDEIASHER